MGQLLKRYRLIETTDANYMEEVLKRSFDIQRFDTGPHPQPFAAAANHWQYDHNLGLSYCAYDADIEVEFPEGDMVRVYMGLSGHAEHSTTAYHGLLAPGANLLLGSRSPVNSRFRSGLRQLVLRLGQDGLRRTLETLAGRPVLGTINFDASGPEASQRLTTTRRLVEILVEHLDEPASAGGSIFERELTQTVQVALLTEVPHNFTSLLTTQVRGVSRSKVQLAEAFIEANWDRPLSIEEIAREAGCSVRSLFKSFQQERGYTPSAFLRRKRLERANDLLLSPHEDVSVATVAIRCGFSNAGHFARYYREQFGVLPSATLRIGRA